MAHALRDATVGAIETLGLAHIQAKDLEIGIFNATLDYAKNNRIPLSWISEVFQEVYLAKARSVFANLNPSSYIGNTRLHKRLEEGEFLPHDIPFITVQSLFPEAWTTLIEKERTRGYDGPNAVWHMCQERLEEQNHFL
jgi:hypothetical protein